MRPQQRGFTLVEILVAGGVSLLLALVLVNIFFHSRRALEHAEGTVTLLRATRIPLDRLTNYISSSASIPGTDVLLYPKQSQGQLNERGQTIANDDPDTWPRYIVLRSTEDFLSPDFNPDSILEVDRNAELLQQYRTNGQAVYDYIIWWEDQANGLDILPNEDKVLAIGRAVQLIDSQGNTILRPDEWAATNPFLDLSTEIPPRVIGRHLEDASFLSLIGNGINVSLLAETTVLTAAQNEQKQFRTTSMVQLAAVTLGP